MNLELAVLPQTASKEFEIFLNRGEGSCDYGRQLLRKHKDRVLAVLENKIVPPYELEIQPSSKCNAKCVHCFGKDYKKLPDLMHEEEMKEIARQVDDFNINGFAVDTVKFCGTTGDPLVNPATLSGINLFKEIGKEVIVFTNGLKLDARKNNERYYDTICKADKLNLSLDAGSEEIFRKTKRVNGFRKIRNSVKTLSSRKNGLKIVVGYVISEHNYTDIENAAREMQTAGADEIRYRVDFTNPRKMRDMADEISKRIESARAYKTENFGVTAVYSKEEIDKECLASSLDGSRCFNYNFWGCIASNLGVYDCGHKARQDVKPHGFVNEKTLKEIWLSKERLNTIKNLPDSSCTLCSPSCKHRNDLMSFLDSVSQETSKEMVNSFG
ncbi:radical SAM protein [Candidatus Woesearchaeota archaeon]|nr:radical SAM protein [Candidatus Woesearchaeota archaeon]